MAGTEPSSAEASEPQVEVVVQTKMDQVLDLLRAMKREQEDARRTEEELQRIEMERREEQDRKLHELQEQVSQLSKECRKDQDHSSSRSHYANLETTQQAMQEVHDTVSQSSEEIQSLMRRHREEMRIVHRQNTEDILAAIRLMSRPGSG
ncbi:hypothetical protein K474DRAFT_930586 [Panus rudis PR-1116 ss-1]|nr:hypothetical protein K474DRAFT_930586 [Panus rudis PR-1116 ss-1]